MLQTDLTENDHCTNENSFRRNCSEIFPSASVEGKATFPVMTVSVSANTHLSDHLNIPVTNACLASVQKPGPAFARSVAARTTSGATIKIQQKDSPPFSYPGPNCIGERPRLHANPKRVFHCRESQWFTYLTNHHPQRGDPLGIPHHPHRVTK